MERPTRHVRRPVKREDVEQYLVITLVSFAASVILIRLFLELTGYPQVGNSELHIAHVLWGGLLLFVASLLPLVFANRWVYKAGALLAGVGVGLFIDEVGKFITQSSNYFYPAAAPIIYAFFLLTVLLYVQVRRPRPSNDGRAELYHALDKFHKVLDRDLDARERADLDARLYRISRHAAYPDIARLASILREFLASDALYIAPDSPSLWERCLQGVRVRGYRWITARRLKVAIVSGLSFLGLVGLLFSLAFILAFITVLHLVPPGALYLEFDLPSGSPEVTGPVPITQLGFGHLVGILAMLGLGGVVGLLLIISAMLLTIGSEQRGSALAYFGLLISLTTVAPINFYFSQFGAISVALAQYALLLGVILYRRHYLVPESGSEPPEKVASSA